MNILIFTFCNHQKLKYNYNKNTIYESKNEKKKKKKKKKIIYIYMSNVNLTWQLQYFFLPKMNSTKHDFLSLCNM